MRWFIAIAVIAVVLDRLIATLDKRDLHEDARLNRLRILGQRGDLNDHYSHN